MAFAFRTYVFFWYWTVYMPAHWTCVWLISLKIPFFKFLSTICASISSYPSILLHFDCCEEKKISFWIDELRCLSLAHFTQTDFGSTWLIKQSFLVSIIRNATLTILIHFCMFRKYSNHENLFIQRFYSECLCKW